MKNTSMLFTLIILFVSCSKSSHDHAKELAQDWINQNSNDPASYQPGDFSSIDTVVVDFYDSEVFKSKYSGLDSLHAAYLAADMVYAASMAAYADEDASIQNSLFSNDKNVLDSLKAMYEKWYSQFLIDSANYFSKPLKMLSMKHTFRAKNGFGALVKQNAIFTFDEGLTKVLKVENTSQQ